MKLRNKVLLGLCLLFLLGTLSGCNVDSEEDDMYSNNDKISTDFDSYSYLRRNESGSEDHINFKYGKFSGTDTIWIIESNGDGEITFNYDSKVDSGDFKGVLITPEKQVETVLEGVDKGEKTIKLSEGEYRFKFVGKKAKGKIDISIEEDDDAKITKMDD